MIWRVREVEIRNLENCKACKWFNSLKIRQKLVVAHSLMLAAIVPGVATGILCTIAHTKQVKSKILDLNEETAIYQELERNFLIITNKQQELALVIGSGKENLEKLAELEQGINNFQAVILSLKHHYQQEHQNFTEEKQNINIVNKILNQYENELAIHLENIKKLIIAAQKSLDYQDLQKYLIDTNNNSNYIIVFNNFFKNLDVFLQQISLEYQNSINILDKSIYLKYWILIISLFLSVIVSYFLGNILSKKISHPLETLKFSVDKASDLIIWFEKTGKIVYANDVALKYLDLNCQKVLQIKFQNCNLVLPIDNWDNFWQELKNNNSINFESSIDKESKEETLIHINIKYLEIEGIAYGFAFGRDITKYKAIENHLILAKQNSDAANQAKSEFIANMSHELRTPLNAVLGFTNLMNHDSNLTPRQIENLKIINRSGEHLLSLINDILNLSKIESGKMTLNINSFDFQGLLISLQEMFLLKANNQGLELAFYYPQETPRYIKTDEQKLRQVFINLLSNAIKFTPSGGVTLQISTNKILEDKIEIKCKIEDTGKGISPEELDLLFQPFIQTSSGKKFQEGTGLGLPISRKFIQLMGGNIEVESIVNRGTIVKFNIVVEIANSDEIYQEGHLPKVIGLKNNQPNYRILVVDDRWENRQILVQLLESVGFELLEAENGQEAVSIWSDWKPHLIWMDMKMPILDGYQATQQIKSHVEGQSTVIIALTASAFEEEKSSIIEAGCDDYISKPFKEPIIWEKLIKYLGVQLIYEEQVSSSNIGNFNSLILEPSALSIMPPNWIADLEKAALELEEEVIIKLLAQIPEEHHLLARALQSQLDNFDFGKLLDLAQQANIS